VALTGVTVSVERHPDGARIEVVARTTGRTGVEMEALTGATAGALALYDMVKGLERGATIGPVRLLAKSGGRSGDWRR
jgi:cyclic pyranopterin phosphate synthase